MTYDKKTWTSKEVINSSSLNNIEDGITSAHNMLEDARIKDDGTEFPSLKDRLNDIDLQLSSTEDSGFMLVDIERFGITNIDFNHKPPYSLEEWEIAYNNMEGFKQAFSYYHEKEVNNIKFPRGFYPMCFRNPEGAPYYANRGWEINIPSQMTVDLNGSTIKVIFDSLNRNPYDKSENPIWALNGGVFVFNCSINSCMKNGEIIGDRYDRAYTPETMEGTGFNREHGQDCSYGISINNSSEYITIENMKIHGFMADSITSNGSSNFGVLYVSNIEYLPGRIVNGELKTDVAGTYTSEFIDISSIKSNRITMSGSGYTYFPTFTNHVFGISFWREDKSYIMIESAEHREDIVVPKGTKYIRITAYNEEPGLESIKITGKFSGHDPQFATIRHCEIFNNNRGGMSNMPHNTVIESCNFYENGMGDKEGWPAFVDSTRYHINCEDIMPRAITIRDCSFGNCYNCILMSSKHAIIENNMFTGCSMSAIVLYNFENAVIANNVVKSGSGLVSFFDKSYSLERTCFISNNVLSDTCRRLYDPALEYLQTKPTVAATNNIINSFYFPEVYGATNTKINLLTQRVPSYTVGKISGSQVGLTMNTETTPYSTSYMEIDMDPGSSGNYINLPGYTINNGINIYGTTLLGVQIFDRENNSNNVISRSTLSAKSLEFRYYNGEDRTRKLHIDNSVITDENSTSTSLISATSNADSADKTLELEIEIINSTIHLKNNITSNLFKVNDSLAPIKTTIRLINCIVINDTDRTIAVNYNGSKDVTYKEIGCQFIGLFSNRQ